MCCFCLDDFSDVNLIGTIYQVGGEEVCRLTVKILRAAVFVHVSMEYSIVRWHSNRSYILRRIVL